MIPGEEQAPIRRVEWCTYRVPYADAFRTAHGAEHVREGALLRVTDADGRVGIGEAAPVPAFGGGTLADVQEAVRPLLPRLLGGLPSDGLTAAIRLRPELPGGGPAAASIETALLDLLGRQLHRPLVASLTDEPATSVPVNATVGAANPAAAVAAARSAVDAGFTCVKLKVGVTATDADEIERIAAVREAIGPATRLRLDANGAWSADRAISLLRAAAQFDLELVEQPVSAADLAGLRRVRATVDVPVAADEAACTYIQAHQVVKAQAADVLVVKPGLAGGPARAQRIVELAREHGLGVVVTSLIDTGIGVAAALQVAAAAASRQPGTAPTLQPFPPSAGEGERNWACGPLACGLATGPLLAADLLRRPLTVRNGWMSLPRGAGLGVELDDAQLARYATPWQPVTEGSS